MSIKTKNIFYVLSIALGIFGLAQSSQAANINVDFTTNLGVIPGYHKYTNAIEKTRGPLDAQLVRALGMEQERAFIVLEVVAPQKGVFNFTDQKGWPYGNDALLDNVISHGALPMISFHHKLPLWLQSARSTVPNNYDDYESVVYTVLKHVKDKYNFIYFDFINEPEMNNIPDTEYSKMYERTARAVTRINNELPAGTPKILISGPGYGWSSNGEKTLTRNSANPTSEPHLSYFLSYLKNNSIPIDFSSYHYYHLNYPDLYARDWDSIVTSKLGVQKPILVTELGWYVYNDPCNTTCTPVVIPNNTNVASSAAYTMFAFHKYMDSGLNITPYHFALNDYARHDRSVMVPTRVSRVDGKVYPLYNALKMWKDVSSGIRVQATSDDATVNGQGVRAVASRSGSTLYLLVYNYGGASTANITIAGYPSGSVNLKRYLVDGTHSNYVYDASKDKLEMVEDRIISHSGLISLPVSMAQNAVTLLVVTGSQNPPPICTPKTEICGNGIDEDCNGSDLACSGGTNLLVNGNFSSGTNNWTFFSDGVGSLSVENGQGKVQITSPGTNVQLNQTNISLEPNTSYRLSFDAYSTSGHDLETRLIKDISPYTNYGLSQLFDLSAGWSTHSAEFTTSGFSGNVSDARFYFWLVPYNTAGDQYYFDNIKLEKIISSDVIAPAAPSGLSVV